MNDWSDFYYYFFSSGGWIKIKLKLPHFHVCIRYINVFRFNPRSRCNSSSRCCYRAREHVDPAWSRRIRHGGDIHPEMSSSPGSVGLARARPLTKKQAMEPSRQTWSSYGPPYLPVGALVLRSNPCHFPRDRNISSRVYIYILRIDMCRLFLLYLVLQLYCIVVIPGMKHIWTHSLQYISTRYKYMMPKRFSHTESKYVLMHLLIVVSPKLGCRSKQRVTTISQRYFQTAINSSLSNTIK